jgi:hypothetical protein
MTSERLEEVFDIVLYLPSLRVAKADDPANGTPFCERDEVQAIAARNQGRHAKLFVPEALVEPDERFIPSQLLGERESQAMTGAVEFVFRWIELEEHALV